MALGGALGICFKRRKGANSPWTFVTSGLIWYRKGLRDGQYVIDYSSDGGTNWELDLVNMEPDEDNIIINIDDGEVGYRHQVRNQDYCIDLALDGIGFAGVEDVNWTNVYKIDK